MRTELSRFIQQTPIYDTHEHMVKEDAWRQRKPDILCELFQNYVSADFAVAGAGEEALKELFDTANPDIEARFNGVRKAWEAVQFTGYGEASRLIARRFFGIETIHAKNLASAQEKLPAEWPAGDRLNILKNEANLDHIQTDDFCWPCRPDASGPDFFLYDLSWANFCHGDLKQRAQRKPGGGPASNPLLEETGVEVKNLETLREAMAKLFEQYAPCAIAVKAQHAYGRTLAWRERSDEEARRALDTVLREDKESNGEAKLALGDWCWARGVELSIEHNLPFKLHTGYYAGHSRMPVERIKAGNLCALLARYPKARFVLMHIAYPYDDELVALAKHYPNVWVDLCWAWSINPHASMRFVRRFLHAAPANKLFGFGGDTGHPRASAAYAEQARKWLTKALQAEVDEGELSEAQAIGVARRLLQENQKACFDLEGTRAAIRAQRAESR